MGWGIFVFLLTMGLIYVALLILAWIFLSSVQGREGFLLLLAVAFILTLAIWMVAAAFAYGHVAHAPPGLIR